jgi:hypothetical protein
VAWLVALACAFRCARIGMPFPAIVRNTDQSGPHEYFMDN